MASARNIPTVPDAMKMKFRDWRRLPRSFRTVSQGRPQVLVSRTGRDFFVPVEFV